MHGRALNILFWLLSPCHERTDCFGFLWLHHSFPLWLPVKVFDRSLQVGRSPVVSLEHFPIPALPVRRSCFSTQRFYSPTPFIVNSHEGQTKEKNQGEVIGKQTIYFRFLIQRIWTYIFGYHHLHRLLKVIGWVTFSRTKYFLISQKMSDIMLSNFRILFLYSRRRPVHWIMLKCILLGLSGNWGKSGRRVCFVKRLQWQTPPSFGQFLGCSQKQPKVFTVKVGIGQWLSSMQNGTHHHFLKLLVICLWIN